MDTNELIKALAADTRPRAAPLSTVWWSATALSVAIAAVVFFATLDVRADIAAAAETLRFLFKFVLTLTLAGGAFGALRTLSRPEGSLRQVLPLLIAAPALLITAVVLELLAIPPQAWPERMIGTSNVYCLVLITMIGLGPLSILLLALCRGAPSNPGIAGALAGLLAGAIAATIYVAHCTDDSPLFVAIWYTIAIAGLTVIGAAGASRLARW
jgi:hypothetical protein